MKEYTCIVCPNGCALKYDEEKDVCTGNRCPRGAKYAKEETVCPMRTVCSTMKTSLKEYPVISVRTSKEIPKKMIFQVMAEINKKTIVEYLPLGTVVISDVLGTGADIITTTDMKKGE